ncbi:hypothetical protein [Mycobacterium intracellulare]|uniref:Uncharacterized protein n=1 Tax=Mycobacterium intracellulare subsp. chimaera TaxID=222805 RepID=A0ABT7P7J2_MYCIT|nr:hypothetical protein [Mycobacterium intracellulare]MDM3929245.1 hypothetical protein [Mycobacterium intracellulare subsp. chimaera]
MFEANLDQSANRVIAANGHVDTPEQIVHSRVDVDAFSKLVVTQIYNGERPATVERNYAHVAARHRELKRRPFTSARAASDTLKPLPITH